VSKARATASSRRSGCGALGYEVHTGVQPAGSLEEAEIRKIEAETAEIQARTKERHLRMALLMSALLMLWALPAAALILGAHPDGADLLRWLPTMLPKS
jgi:hypothetical protein